MMGSIFCNHKNEKTSPLCLLGDFCWKWWAQLSQSSSDISEVSYCGTSSGWANVEGNAQDHQVDKQQCSTNEWHLKWPLLSCYTRHVLCSLQTERWKICFIDKPEEWIMILRGKSASHTGNSSVDSTPFLLTDFCHCKTWGNGREMGFDLGSLWIVSFQNCCEMKWLQIVAVKCKQEIQMAGKKY